MSHASGNLSVEAQVRYAYVERLLLKDVRPPASVVELGAAPGNQIAQLADQGFRTTSVDIGTSADAWGAGEVGGMTKLLAEHGVTDITWDLEVAPYPLGDGAFDAVIMTEVFEHLRDYPVRSLYEVARILRPGGRLYFTTPNAAYLVNRVRSLQGHNATASSLADWIGGVPHARHAREYTFPEIRTLIELVGLRIVTLESRHFHLTTGRQSGAARLVKRGLAELAVRRPSLGPQIVLVAERPA